MFRKFTLILVIIVSFSTSQNLFSQTITGQVVDENKIPIIGAYVIHTASDHHAHTNESGKFILFDVALGDTLQISYLGFKPLFHQVEQLNNGMIIKMEAEIFLLDEVVIGQNSKTTNIISYIDNIKTPVQNSQELLRNVPGLFIGQHAGGGKAEQIFLRGFDIDHGTDVSLSVDGMPVNMVSHAHGQGYSDMHFVIPETVDLIDFGKGPYYADRGNFNTAGYVALSTKDRLENSQIKLEYGQFNTFRASGLLNLVKTEKHNAYLATEFLLTDGPVVSPQNFSRSNFMGKYTGQITNRDRVSISASHFTSEWDASGQIPIRAIEQGLITRFGSIDNTEGGQTSRTNLNVEYIRSIDDRTFINNKFFYALYDFTLYSNFTFFLEDPINGDQIKQTEDRALFGFESSWNHTTANNNGSTLWQLGVGMRNDQINDIGLSRTLQRRTTLENIQLGEVDERNIYGFAKADFDFGNLLLQPSVRFDYFKFDYINSLDSLYNRKSQSKGRISPKFNVVYTLNPTLQLYAKTGIGFHSNDARVVLEQDNASILPAAYGADLGVIIKPAKRLFVNAALWYLFLDQEFVYVGDAGIVEPSGKTRRLGVDLGLRVQLADWLFAYGDINYAYARSVEDPEGQNYIPLAPDLTSTAGLNITFKNFDATLKMRYLKDRPANEDNSIIAEGYIITDMNATYRLNNISFGFVIENLFNREWNEAQFATESRLSFENNPVEEIHFTPGTPFFIKGMATYRF